MFIPKTVYSIIDIVLATNHEICVKDYLKVS